MCRRERKGRWLFVLLLPFRSSSFVLLLVLWWEQRSVTERGDYREGDGAEAGEEDQFASSSIFLLNSARVHGVAKPSRWRGIDRRRAAILLILSLLWWLLRARWRGATRPFPAIRLGCSFSADDVNRTELSWKIWGNGRSELGDFGFFILSLRELENLTHGEAEAGLPSRTSSELVNNWWWDTVFILGIVNQLSLQRLKWLLRMKLKASLVWNYYCIHRIVNLV